jgi:hypothetical protein
VLTIGQIESGLFREDIETGLRGSYADLGYPDFVYEVVVGDETFLSVEEGGFDSWKEREARLAEKRREAGEDEEEEEEQPFEKVKVRVTFPKVQELSNEIVLERWIPWIQVYGETDEEEAGPGGTNDTAGGPSAGGSPK